MKEKKAEAKPSAIDEMKKFFLCKERKKMESQVL